MQHFPVLKNEVLNFWLKDPNGTYLDMTFGSGGHSRELLKQLGDKAKLFIIDANENAYNGSLEFSKEFLGKVVPLKGNFRNFDRLLEEYGKDVRFDGVLADLGLSMMLITESGRGFTFQKDEPLDMRMDLSLNVKAEDIVNNWSINELSSIFYEYGEEKLADKIAKAIVELRRKERIVTTFQLKKAILSVKKGGKIHPATKVFQALRIVVNDELEALKEMLLKIPAYMKDGGRLLIISFHSLEDRIVKNKFKEWEKDGFGKRLTKKVIMASSEEYKINPPSRSAKLRVFEFGRSHD